MYSDAQYIKDLFTGEVNAIRCLINGFISVVPMDESNADYQNIMALVAEGKLTIAPAEGGQ